MSRFIHIYFILNGPVQMLLKSLPKPSSSCQQCPHCRAKSTTETTTKRGYSLLRGEEDVEADPIQYRDSEDFLGTGAERAKQAQQPEEAGKGKDVLEV